MRPVKPQATPIVQYCCAFSRCSQVLDSRPYRGWKPFSERRARRRSREYCRCTAQGPIFQEQIREITESLPVQGWPLYVIMSACAALAAYTALQILLWDYRNRRTDDPAEKDRSESYSIKQPKTYTWKQENIRIGKLPRQPDQPKAKEPRKEEPSIPDLLNGISWDEVVELISQEGPDSFKELLWIMRNRTLSGLFAAETMNAIRFMRDVWAKSIWLLSLVGQADNFGILRALTVLKVDFSSLRLEQGLMKQVTGEVAALSAVTTMNELLGAAEIVDESLGLRTKAPQQQTSGSRP